MMPSAPCPDATLLEAVKRGLPVRLLDARGRRVSRVYVDGYEVTKFGPVTGTLNFYR